MEDTGDHSNEKTFPRNITINRGGRYEKVANKEVANKEADIRKLPLAALIVNVE